MKTHTDRPPILRFLLIFVTGLALVTALAALSHAADAPSEDASTAALTTQR